MLKDAAIHWVRNNCPNRKISWDVKEALDVAASEGANCWFLIGGALTRSGAPFLLHCYCGELFLFQLTDAQASTLGVAPTVMASQREGHPHLVLPLHNAPVSLERFEVLDPVLTQTTPIRGRLAYQSLGRCDLDWCVRLDFYLYAHRYTAWYYPVSYPFSHQGVIDVQFLPIAPTPDVATNYKGPLALFARIFENSSPAELRRPLSTACATMVEVI